MKFGSLLGSGAFSDVYTAQENGTERAVKVCYKDGFADGCHCLRELDMVLRASKEGGVVRVVNVTKEYPRVRASERKDEIHLIMEKGDTNLFNYISRNGETPEYWRNVRKIMIQLLSTLVFTHHRRIMHRDLKPENIIIFNDKGSPEAKITDFGISKLHNLQRANTPQVVTINYRAPEIALECPTYDTASDIWSLGMVFYDMINLTPFGYFFDAEDETQLLEMMFDFIPNPLNKDQQETLLPEKYRELYRSKPHPKKTTRSVFFTNPQARQNFARHAGKIDQFCDLLSHMVDFDWRTRYSAKECLAHPFFSESGSFALSKVSQFLGNFSTKIDYPDYPERSTMKGFIRGLIELNVMTKDVLQILLETAILVDSYYDGLAKGKIARFSFETVIFGLQYLALKYHNVLTPISDLSGSFGKSFTAEELADIKDFELTFVCDFCLGRFYIEHMIDFADRVLTVEECEFLLMQYLDNEELKGKTHEEAFHFLYPRA